MVMLMEQEKKRMVRCAGLVVALSLVVSGFAGVSRQVTAQVAGGREASALTVRGIMAEPSLAGMRVEGERVSPDGKSVAYLWSAAGKEPRDLYVVSTSGGTAKVLVRAVDSVRDERASKTETRDAARTDANREERIMQRDAAQAATSTTQATQTAQQTAQHESQTTQTQERDRMNRERAVSVGAPEWSPDSRRILYAKRGDLYVVNVEGAGAPRRLTTTAAVETGARWLDEKRVMYQSGGNVFAFDTVDASLVQVTREAGGGAANIQAQGVGSMNSITGVTPSEDGSRIAYIVSDTSKQRALIVPNYTGEFVTAPTFRRGWTEQKLFVTKTDGTSERATEIKLPAPEGASYIRGVRWSDDNAGLIVDRIDRDTKRRQILYTVIANSTSALTNNKAKANGAVETSDVFLLIDEETDDKWIASLSRIVEPAPKGDAILFASERDGFNHLYLRAFGLDPKLATPRQLTRGNYEVSWAAWLPDGERVVYSSTEGGTAERQFYIVNTRTNDKVKLNVPRGMNTDPQVSKNGETMVFESSQALVPNDVYAMNLNRMGDAPVRVTDTVPDAFKNYKWSVPEFVSFKAKDGKQVAGRVYVPRGFDKARAQKYPMVVFVHGAGYLQNVINGWNNYYREAMFHTLLNERGYVVLDIDYRGSAGYGRAWRTDVYDFLGGLDLQDHLDGIDYAVANFNADKARVGMYGGSYGGFMAEMAAMRAPEHVACAAALRPVADWKNYFASSPVYTTERLGYPDKNAAAYKRSSPITYADKLTRPLLILHGMVDDNVPVQDSVQLVERLIELGKTEHFDVMFYPSENHGFTKAESWADEYERILRFFEVHLKK
ncbi:MAG: S9 family peptidase [Pyrinomonadaceae bacterium MAG19_C2-C3]|nr:S9 family peptidase [Pyrinomonadaceae bacterium MAG19_C2-C3]